VLKLSDHRADTDDVETLDTTVLDELRGLDGEDLRDIVELYFTDVVDQIDRLRSSIEEGDCAAVSAAAHRIKGASLSMGAARVAAFASDTETAAREGDLSPCAELVEALEGELEPTREALGSELHVALS
jgi:HPt (histidine-containing phosphotransfer) domain-containing protein